MPFRNPVQRGLETLGAAAIAVVVSRLPDQSIRLVNQAALDFLGLPRASLVGLGTRDLTEMPDSTDTGMAALASGAVDSYHATRRICRPDGTEFDAWVWVRPVDDHPTRYAVSLFVPQGDPEHSAALGVGPNFGPVATDLTIGTMDESSRIHEVASSTDVVLGLESASMIGRHLLDFVHPDDADDVQRALCTTADDGTDTTVMVRARHADGEWINVLWLTFRGPGPDAESLAFALAEPTAAARTRPQIDRAAALEQHLRRISSELTAAGLLAANPAAIPEEESRVLADLSARQREIVTRLMRGERVPGIAAAMHLSPATVRNHLTRVFERFGVHSQAEMIAVLRSPHGDAPVP